MYNSTASEWQNTNLGVSVTPTLTGDTTAYATLTYIVTISNHATYDDPAYFCEVYTDTGTLTVQNSDVTDNLDGTLSFTVPAIGDYQIRVKCQDFGDLQSEVDTLDFTSEAFGGTFRYWRVANFLGTPSNMGLKNVRFFTGPGQSGTMYPPFMTSANTPTPYVANASYYYTPSGATYAPFRAFDSSVGSSMWWTLGRSPASLLSTDWVEIDLGSSINISSLSVGPWHSQQPTQFQVLASDTGAFTGEETIIATVVTTGGQPIITNVYNIG